MALELHNHYASIKHINARKEGPDGDEVLAVDLKLEVEADATDVLHHFDNQLNLFLFMGSEVRFPLISPLEWGGEMHNMEMELSGFEFRSVKLSKFKIKPFVNAETGAQRVSLTMSASFRPKSNELATLAELLNEDAKITVFNRQQELSI